ncbi:MAG: hypothetical protein AB7I27_01105 [Bacteriovoracaceae bacterium]
MALKFSVLFLLSFSYLSLPVSATTFSEEKFFRIKKIETQELSSEKMTQESFEEYQKLFKINGLSPNNFSGVDPVETTSKVIQVTRDLVALGEEIYNLVIKGKPTNVTEYSPISIVPKVDGKPVEILDTENWKVPVKKTYQVIFENVYGIDVVTFRYSVLYAYGGSYDGAGAYLTAVQIVPESVKTLFGWDFKATMKLGGIQNLGTKKDPIAGVTLLMEYTVNTVFISRVKVDQYFISGKGEFKSYQR